ncbi:MobC family plasmid mobilization relaxosome protein [Streptomyces radicis]|uniref:MobC family plasmid mobilization relaxosome protein n=1 Tax=Streptomyces radicis TaxID=1750517 RepID=UPI001E415ACA|nr:MobC family plasmid mobilization relaxosome protein [Streptomyces radicis]
MSRTTVLWPVVRRRPRSATPDDDLERDAQLPPPTPAFPARTPRCHPRDPTRRVHKLTVRLSTDEKAEIATAALAAARGTITVHTNDRLDAAIDELAALRTQVARVGNNVNQIARLHNAGGQFRPAELLHALTVLHRVLARVDEAADAQVRRRA